LAVLLRRSSIDHPDWRLRELTEELAIIARNERRFLGFSKDDIGFDPEQYRGKVVVATLHKAKGLEWDRVYIISGNNYDFPSGDEYDTFIAEKWFLREHLNLEAETLHQLDLIVQAQTGGDLSYSTDWVIEGVASKDARIDYIRERLRLLYVGITRARRELIITWNNGRQGKSQMALPLAYLSGLDLNNVADLPLPALNGNKPASEL
jgi:DNA helicase-2/ATP-dependent DNA helicase PcrA